MENLFFTQLILSTAELTEKTSHETAQLRPTDILVSILYFAAALALIYLVLVLVSKAGKKDYNKLHSDNCGDEKEINGENGSCSSAAEETTETSSCLSAAEKNTETGTRLSGTPKNAEIDTRLNAPKENAEASKAEAPKNDEKGGLGGE